jgi:hypothetical protein
MEEKVLVFDLDGTLYDASCVGTSRSWLTAVVRCAVLTYYYKLVVFKNVVHMNLLHPCSPSLTACYLLTALLIHAAGTMWMHGQEGGREGMIVL